MPNPTTPPATPLQDPTVTVLLQQSATLRQDLQQLRHDGFTVEWGDAGKGTYYDAPHSRIVVDRNQMGHGAAIVQSLSHEYGHHSFKEPEDYSSRDAYVNRSLRNEATATLSNAVVRDEIRAAGGPDIGIAGSNHVAYEKIAGDLSAGRINREAALSGIATAFGNEHPSVAPQGDYRDYYGGHYDTAVVPWLRSTGRLPAPQDQQPALDNDHPAAPMFKALRGQLPASVADAHVLDAAVKAQASVHQDTAWVFSSQTPGLRVQTDLSQPALALEDALARSQALAAGPPSQDQQVSPTLGR
ncbi:hypothetical protein [Pseudoxanthomonas sp.]|uniref:hypothetical protein n=1 Tax=Pseudoxanthomonas sp. TaxID=1871049 RepID=UPI002629CEC4|nr:hypothetical protein [Pseudoxanthomonas sp.]WDS35281.1 MAG: hypothetical protein O8I58_13080 [Pseudoxanthomonas sp.]